MPDPCPTRDQLHDYAVGLLPEDVAERLTAHLAQCPRCEETIAGLGESSDPLIALLSHKPPCDSVLEESQLTAALSLIEAIGVNPRSIEGADTPDVATAPLERIGAYELLAQLGRGGMGTVYKARHTKLDKIVALKVLPADRMQNANAVNRFEREMKAVGKLSHPNIVAAHDAGEIDGTHYLVMELVDGLDLSTLLRAVGPAASWSQTRPASHATKQEREASSAATPRKAMMTVADACELVRQAAVGLQEAHEHGMVHRDIKPSNLMLSRQRYGEPIVKILDLGLALLNEASAADRRDLTTTGQLMGTLNYMAPEQGTDSHSVDIRADIYALGATLFKLLVGRAPFSGDVYNTPLKMMIAKASMVAPSLGSVRDDLPAELVAVVDRMLALDPADRYARPADVAEALAPFCADSDLAELLRQATAEGPERLDDQSAVGTQNSLQSESAETDPALIPESALRELASAARGYASTVAPISNRRPRGARRSLATYRAKQRAHVRRWFRRPRVAIATALGGMAALIVFGVILTLKTARGTVEVRLGEGVSADEVQIEVSQGDRLHVIDKNNNWQIDLEDGRWNVRLKNGSDRFTIDKQSVTVRRRGKELVTVTLRDQTQAPQARNPQVLPNEPDRRTFALQFIGGYYGQVLDRDDRVTIPSLTYDASHPLTIEAFVEPESTGTVIECVADEGNVIVSLDRAGDSSGGYYWIGKHVSDGGRATVSTQEKLGVDPHVGVGRKHVALVWDGQEVRLYVSGRLGGRSAGKVSFPPRSSHFVIGRHFQGQMDELRISKVARYRDAFEPPVRFADDDRVLAVYHFDEGQGERLVDSSGNNHHGNIVGAAWVPSSEAVDFNHRAAAWVLSVGGAFKMSRRPGGGRTIATRDEIPQSPFYLMVDLTDVPKERVSAEGVSLLNGTRTRSLTFRAVDESVFVQLENLPLLAYLDFHSPPGTLSHKGLAHLTRFSTLVALTLWNQNVEDGDLELICRKLLHLGKLEVPGTKITDASVPHLARLRGLSILNIQNTQISDRGIPALGRLPSLRELWLDGTQLTARSAESFKDFPKLVTIHVVGPKLVEGLRNVKLLPESIGVRIAGATDAELASLSDAVQLSKLNLHNSPSLTSAGVKHLQTLTSLTELDLGLTLVDDKGLAYLERMNKLRTLSLRGTRVTAAGVAKLQKALPNCKILSDYSDE